MTPAAYVVRPGFVYTDESGATPRAYAAGETVLLDPAVGDRAHQLERAAPPAPPAPAAPPKRSRVAAAVQAVEQAVEHAAQDLLA